MKQRLWIFLDWACEMRVSSISTWMPKGIRAWTKNGFILKLLLLIFGHVSQILNKSQLTHHPFFRIDTSILLSPFTKVDPL